MHWCNVLVRCAGGVMCWWCDLALQARELIHVVGDTHVYKNHVEALQEQLLRWVGAGCAPR